MKTVGIVAYGRKHSGGIYQYTIAHLEALRHDPTHRYVVFTWPDCDEYDHLGLEVRKLPRPEYAGIRMLIRLFLLKTKWRTSALLTRTELDAFRDIDAFLSPVPELFPAYYLDKPFAFTLHDLQELYYPDFFTARDRLRRTLVNGALIQAATRIITESEHVRSDVLRFAGGRAEQVTVLTSPPTRTFLEKSFAPGEIERVKAQYGLPERYLYYPAHFWPHKNHMVLLQAIQEVARAFPDVHLVLTGAQHAAFGPVMTAVQDMGLAGRVHYPGYVAYADLPAIYKGALMLVMPTLFESVSIPVYEAFALEVPVVASNVTALPEQIGDAGLLFDPARPEELAAAIERLLTEPDLAARLAARGRQRLEAVDPATYARNLTAIVSALA